MATDPAFASVINNGSGLLSAGAETDLQVPTKTTTILTAGASGTKIDEIVAQMTSTGAGGLVATTVAGLIYVFLYDGATYHLYDTIAVRAITASTTVAPYRSLPSDFASGTSRPPNLVIKTGWSLRCSQSIAGNQSATLALKVSAFGADL